MSDKPARPASGIDAASPVSPESPPAAPAWRERFEEPVERATELTRRTLAWFPVRVWRHFLAHNGFLLAAGVSYQALFAIFAAIYLAFAIAGIAVGSSDALTQNLIDVINAYIPGLIADGGAITPKQIESITATSASLFGFTGSVALVALIWTAIGWVTYSRYAVRDIFGLPKEPRPYVLMKARDLLAAVIFGLALLLGAALGGLSTWALDSFFALLGLEVDSFWYESVGRITALLVAFAVDAGALAALFRFLSGTSLRWRLIWPGSLLGGAAIVVVQIGAGWLFARGPSNPLLATFAVFIGLLLWFRLVGIITLVAAAWIAVAAQDANVPLTPMSEYERQLAEYKALVVAAEVRVREARAERDTAPWVRAWMADRAVRRAEDELARVKTLEPAPKKARGLLDPPAHPAGPESSGVGGGR
ncbi:MAG TPA: YihY/virulence factor BrkB family protein [Microbacterium sp.]|uniref:YihY/virulence factor BrkB family protein n=1 Tax=Microbacterium sp. TaxID=51671 RepID=UPI002CEF2AF8|nr:YihY/virulence factor BrkB family protein [Microbacterium sp.]HWI29885.1 YihY/virulence factor BrkB family protein [Microbacterium sp.]